MYRGQLTRSDCVGTSQFTLKAKTWGKNPQEGDARYFAGDDGVVIIATKETPSLAPSGTPAPPANIQGYGRRRRVINYPSSPSP